MVHSRIQKSPSHRISRAGKEGGVLVPARNEIQVQHQNLKRGGGSFVTVFRAPQYSVTKDPPPFFYQTPFGVW